MSFNYRVAGYVKLAKLWEKNKEAALLIKDIDISDLSDEDIAIYDTVS